MSTKLRNATASVIARFGRTRRLQPLYERLLRLSLIGLNVGGVRYGDTGELSALNQLRGMMPSAEGALLDVGANVGDYYQLLRTAFGAGIPIHCFEPCAGTFQLLQRRVANDPHVHPHRMALGKEARTALLYSRKREGDLEATLLAGDTDGAISEEVQVQTVTRFCAAHGINRIQLLKIDTEGADFDVLLGAQELIEGGRVGAIQFEFGQRHLRARRFLRDYFELLSGFQFYRVVQDGLHPVRYSYDLEQFGNEANYVAVLQSR